VEVMTIALDPARIEASLDRALAGADAVVIGPGLGLDAAARAAIDHVVLRFAGPKIVDADAITAFEGRGAELARAAGACLLTPHPGELGRLLGTTAAVVEADRFGALDRALALTGQTVLLKGPHTLIGRPQKTPWISSTGRPVLATGGSGDVLSGLCGALAVGRALEHAGAAAAHIHGQAAQSWARAHAGADRGLLAHELLDHVPVAIAALVERRSSG
jgi:NAD(P)H-hydrate epimerase